MKTSVGSSLGCETLVKDIDTVLGTKEMQNYSISIFCWFCEFHVKPIFEIRKWIKTIWNFHNRYIFCKPLSKIIPKLKYKKLWDVSRMCQGLYSCQNVLHVVDASSNMRFTWKFWKAVRTNLNLITYHNI